MGCSAWLGNPMGCMGAAGGCPQPSVLQHYSPAPQLTHRSPAGTLRSLLAAEALPLCPAAVPQAGRPPGAAWALQTARELSPVCPCCDVALRPLRGEGEGCGAVGRGISSRGRSLQAPVLELQLLQPYFHILWITAAFPCHHLLFSLCVSLTPENGN